MTRRNLLAGIILAAVIALLPLAPFTNAYHISVIVRALTFIMLGQAWNVIAGVGGQLSLGHGVFFGVGAYTVAFLFNDYGVTPWLGLFAALAVAVLLALIIGLGTFRSRGVYFALATVAISLGFEKVARFLTEFTGGDAGLAVNFRGTAPWAMQFRDPAAFLWIDLAVVIGFFLYTRWLLSSRFGLRLQAVRDDEDAAAASGVNVLGTKLAGLAVSAAMTALAGVLHVQFYLAIDPGTAFGLFQGIQIQLPALIGGLGTAFGPIIGGAIAILLSEATNWWATVSDMHGADTLVYGVVLLVVVLYAPGGVIGALRKGRR